MALRLCIAEPVIGFVSLLMPSENKRGPPSVGRESRSMLHVKAGSMQDSWRRVEEPNASYAADLERV